MWKYRQSGQEEGLGAGIVAFDIDACYDFNAEWLGQTDIEPASES